MAAMFSNEWMGQFQQVWNSEPELSGELAKIGFNSVIGYGFDGDDAPKGVITVENGQVVSAGSYNGESLNWDLRAKEDNWKQWFADPPGMMALGIAYTTRKLKFNKGDYSAIIKDPRMTGPFIKSFAAMGKVEI